MNYLKILCLTLLAVFAPQRMLADDDPVPTISPYVNYFDINGDEVSTDFSAPLTGKFYGNAENVGAWNEYYEWRFTLEGELEPYLIRYEQDTEYVFTKAGTHRIVLYATFTQGNDTIAYTDEYWNEVGPFTVAISESKLTMPNAFSPNGDTHNDIYKAKEWKSLVEFHATIYNRWGQKLYEWDNPAEGWDGKFHGTDVKQGVYFVEVKAQGADGRKYHIRRDVNLMRGYRNNESSSSSSSDGGSGE